jgi:outer membrane protein OmpA-like peptidoglycan-associated protein
MLRSSIYRSCPGALLLAAVFTVLLSTSAEGQQQRIDYLSFANGAIPVDIEAASTLAVGMEQALEAIDGNDGGFTLTPKPGDKAMSVAFVYKLPAMTRFTDFAVPNVLETPSPSQTFVRTVEVAGSDSGPEGPFHVLAQVTLRTHAARGESTALRATGERPVRWVRVTLQGGIDVQREKTFFEFSEISGYGTQEVVPLLDSFTGKWKGRGVLLELTQEGERVTGCYDRIGDLDGTVTGNILHATGKDRNTGVPSVFVLTVGDKNEITGVRSTNGAPFRLYTGDAAPTLKAECAAKKVKPFGCGSIIHGILFDYDAAVIKAESAKLLDALSRDLKASTAERIVVVGHTSNEGSDDYNEKLSQRRAEAVVAAMIARGIDAGRLAAEGRGEKLPIADNSTEAGRSLNRRVEISCRDAARKASSHRGPHVDTEHVATTGAVAGSEVRSDWLIGEWNGVQIDTRMHMRVQATGDVWIQSVEGGREKTVEGRWQLKDAEFTLDIPEGTLQFSIEKLSTTSFRLFGKAASSDIVFTRKGETQE